MEKGVLMNQDGQVLQDSQGKPKRVVLGEDGRTIFGNMLESILHNIYTYSTELKHTKIVKSFSLLAHFSNKDQAIV